MEKDKKNYVPGFVSGLLTAVGYTTILHSQVSNLIDKARGFVYDSEVFTQSPGEYISWGIGALVVAGAGATAHYFANRKKEKELDKIWENAFNEIKKKKEKGKLSDVDLYRSHKYLSNLLYTRKNNNSSESFEEEQEALDDLIQDVELRLR